MKKKITEICVALLIIGILILRIALIIIDEGIKLSVAIIKFRITISAIKTFMIPGLIAILVIILLVIIILVLGDNGDDK